jgi:hypothetical protein
MNVHRLSIVSCAVLSSFLGNGIAHALEESANVSARVAGERAHFANEFCGASPELIASYRRKAKAALPDASDFERQWNRGWTQEANKYIQYRAARATDPKEFSIQVKADCARLERQARNAVSASPASK